MSLVSIVVSKMTCCCFKVTQVHKSAMNVQDMCVPEGLVGVLSRVLSSFMSLILWMYMDSSRHTTSRWSDRDTEISMTNTIWQHRVEGLLPLLLPVCWAWPRGCCWSSCSCKSPYPSWSGKRSFAVAWTNWPPPPGCWRTAAPLYRHLGTQLERDKRKTVDTTYGK